MSLDDLIVLRSLEATLLLELVGDHVLEALEHFVVFGFGVLQPEVLPSINFDQPQVFSNIIGDLTLDFRGVNGLLFSLHVSEVIVEGFSHLFHDVTAGIIPEEFVDLILGFRMRNYF